LGNKLHGNAAHVQIFYQDSWHTLKLIPMVSAKLMDCSAMVFMDELLNFSNIFCRFAGAWSL
jgi:hypothetical protein